MIVMRRERERMTFDVGILVYNMGEKGKSGNSVKYI